MNLKGFSNPKVLRRFIILLGIATFVMFSFWAVFRNYLEAPPGDFEVRQGDILLGDGKYNKALERFDAALAASPDHRGALMGRALAFLQTKRHADAEAEFTYLIAYLRKNLAPDDATGAATLAAAYANRGILHDRLGRYQKAFADYVEAMKVDEGAVDGPSLIDKVIYGTPRPATIRQRAIYIGEQLALPAHKRLLRIPEKDAEQRMYKPF
ncbi:MAG: tetratricopeptide repeat protein [Alphaproteobacteria bacterium]|nr:tetratricopeptide repeat protein [Alphaproteobacteria bacterium]